MCCLIVCPHSNRPSLQTLRQVVAANPHGLGIAWNEGGTVHWLKSDDVEEISELASLIRGTVVIHARWASVGGVRPELRHPFPVTDDCELSDRGTAPAVLFQNGTWLDWQREVQRAEAEGHVAPAGPMSDARAAAWLVRVRRSANFLQRIGSRWVLCRAKREPIMVGTFSEYRGCHFSNMYWHRDQIPRPTPPRLTTPAIRKVSPARRPGGSEPGSPKGQVRELPDRMPAQPWFTLSDEFKATAKRVRERGSIVSD